MMKKLLTLKFVIVIASFLITFSVQAQDLDQGKMLFKNNCASCHSKDMKTKMTGPALGGVQERWEGREDVLYKWIKNSTAVIESGDEYANAIFQEFNKVPMTGFPNLKDEEIANMLAYISGVNDGSYGPKKAAVVAGAEVTEEKGSSFWIYAGLFGLLAIFSYALFLINNNLRQHTQIQENVSPTEQTLWSVFSGKTFVGLLLLIGVILGGYFTINGAMNIGRQQGYQPDQPIQFSHKTHAGLQQIDCKYCHDGARRSKHSVIPSTNTCMNCHKAVQKGSTFGTAEITKIFASIGYNPNTGNYIEDYENMKMDDVEAVYKKWIVNNNDDNEREATRQWNQIVKSLTSDVKPHVGGPIPWVRIHNLPDHVYYNHAQHVSVAKLECETCHGKIEEMEVVEQHAPLSMGWCVNCHRKTDVKFVGNEYYESYEKLHKELQLGERESVKVSDIGGIECQKCHY